MMERLQRLVEVPVGFWLATILRRSVYLDHYYYKILGEL